jgi:cell pole-organizing protein PopZ
MSTTNEKDANSQDEVILAIRKIIEAEQALMSDGEELHEASDAVQSRIEAALHRLAGGGPEHAPTVLEALILERLDPVLNQWMAQSMAPMVERILREEIRALMLKSLQDS